MPAIFAPIYENDLFAMRANERLGRLLALLTFVKERVQLRTDILMVTIAAKPHQIAWDEHAAVLAEKPQRLAPQAESEHEPVLEYSSCLGWCQLAHADARKPKVRPDVVKNFRHMRFAFFCLRMSGALAY